jgi:hypothetical protein
MCKAGKDLRGKSQSQVSMTEKPLEEEMIEKVKGMRRWMPRECPALWAKFGGVLGTAMHSCSCIATSSSMHDLLSHIEPEENERISDLHREALAESSIDKDVLVIA